MAPTSPGNNHVLSPWARVLCGEIGRVKELRHLSTISLAGERGVACFCFLYLEISERS